ncbi:MAG TPA: hypothetical protein PLY86_15170 [bacterium]|nr:hypothetical protein [bacterium]
MSTQESVNERTRILSWVLSILFIGTIICIAYFFFGHILKDYLQRTEFNSEIWKDTKTAHNPPYPRLRMVDDLLRRNELIGMNREEVVALLGERDQKRFGECDFVYFLGPQRSFISIDSEWLTMKLNPEGYICEVLVLTD